MIASLDSYCSRQEIDVEFDGASSGEELVEKVLAGSYDLVFTDNHNGVTLPQLIYVYFLDT